MVLHVCVPPFVLMSSPSLATVFDNYAETKTSFYRITFLFITIFVRILLASYGSLDLQTFLHSNQIM